MILPVASEGGRGREGGREGGGSNSGSGLGCVRGLLT